MAPLVLVKCIRWSGVARDCCIDAKEELDAAVARALGLFL
jgi:hypothetical protein